MPSSHHTKIKERCRLADRINLRGIEMPACSRCEKKGAKCISSTDSRRCSECVRSNSRCNASGPSEQDWVKLQKEEDRLTAAEIAAEEQAMAAHRLADEALSRMRRLRVQKKFLRERGAEMLRRGLATLDELDEAEEKDRQEIAKQAELSTASLATVGDLSDVFDNLSPSFWQGLDVVDGTPATTPGS
jgi:hypothetical protein